MIFAFSITVPAAAMAMRVECPAGDVVVASADPDDASAACEAALDAIEFLEANGLARGAQFEINIVNRLPAGHIAHALGLFEHHGRRLSVLSYAAITESGMSILGLPPNRDLYRSLVAHEVAHLIAIRNFAFDGPAVVAQEYIACVTQLAVVPSSQRETILGIYTGSGFAGLSQINLTYYLADPNLFAVQAYRHYRRPENGAMFLRNLLLMRNLVLD